MLCSEPDTPARMPTAGVKCWAGAHECDVQTVKPAEGVPAGSSLGRSSAPQPVPCWQISIVCAKYAMRCLANDAEHGQEISMAYGRMSYNVMRCSAFKLLKS